MSIELPKGIIKAVSTSPKSLFIYSPPKCGKTTLGAMLPNSLLIDLENGSDFVDAVKIKINNTKEIQELGELLKVNNPMGMNNEEYAVIDSVDSEPEALS